MTDKIAKAAEVYGRVSKEAALFDDGYGELAAVFVAAAEFAKAVANPSANRLAWDRFHETQKALNAALQRAAEKVMQ